MSRELREVPEVVLSKIMNEPNEIEGLFVYNSGHLWVNLGDTRPPAPQLAIEQHYTLSCD